MASEIAKVKARAANARSKALEVEHAVTGKVVAYGTGAGLAYAEHKGLPLAIGGVPTKLVIGFAGAIGELMTKGATRRLLASVSTAALVAHGYNAVRSGAFIAGIDEVSGGEL